MGMCQAANRDLHLTGFVRELDGKIDQCFQALVDLSALGLSLDLALGGKLRLICGIIWVDGLYLAWTQSRSKRCNGQYLCLWVDRSVTFVLLLCTTT